ncbi:MULTISPECIES: M15 family metallopeptidase [unclassified Cryobacterium]|uniref:M15 family metallopeptidase n=1 Tax=unclassified Cryobacterium TaxID=2649013 RepID=UPI001F544AE8|nr:MULTISPECIES: M15 family metallopeptidase [unclassified Cryobacterium]
MLSIVISILAAGAVAAGALTGETAPPVVGSAVVPTLIPRAEPSANPTPPRAAPTGSPEPVVMPTFDRSARSRDDPASLWVVVDKTRPLNPTDYAPTDLVDVPVAHVWSPQLRREASDATVALFSAFEAETGLKLQSHSAYRNFAAQVMVYDADVAANGQAFADTSTARPGTSEHQTGLAIDISALPGICSLDACFGDTPQGQWLAVNAWRFGFLLRYPADKVAITGYGYEPWHFRYIGTELAMEMHATGTATLEEFFGLPAAPGYH